MAKNLLFFFFFWSKMFVTSLKNKFELKILNCLKIMLRHNSRHGFFFQIFELDNIFDNFDQKVKKKVNFFCQKITFLAYFGTFDVVNNG